MHHLGQVRATLEEKTWLTFFIVEINNEDVKEYTCEKAQSVSWKRGELWATIQFKIFFWPVLQAVAS